MKIYKKYIDALVHTIVGLAVFAMFGWLCWLVA